MAKLFEPTEIKDLQLPNRFIRSAAHGLANDNGTCSPELVDAMVELARGGVGLIITGHAYVSQGGQAQPRQLGVQNDSFMEGLNGCFDVSISGQGLYCVQARKTPAKRG